MREMDKSIIKKGLNGQRARSKKGSIVHISQYDMGTTCKMEMII